MRSLLQIIIDHLLIRCFKVFQWPPGKLLQREEKKMRRRCQTGDSALCIVTPVFASKLDKSIFEENNGKLKNSRI